MTDRYLRDVAPADLIALGKSRTWTEKADRRRARRHAEAEAFSRAARA